MTADPSTTTSTPTPSTPRYLPPASPLLPPPGKRKRRWTGARSAAALGYLWLLLVIVCVGAMSWTGLVGFATDVLKLPAPLCYGVPIALDGSAITLAFLALRGVLSGGAAGLPRLLAVIVVAASSGFNYYQARESGGGGAAEVFFAGMSVLVYVMFEVILRHNRRQQLEERGAIEPPLARFRVARWLRNPKRTFDAWSVAIDQGLTSPQQALEVVRQRPPRSHWWTRRPRPPVYPTPRELAEPNPPLVDHGPQPEPPARAEPIPRGRARNEDARKVIRELLLERVERGDDLTAREAGEAVGVKRGRGQQLLTEVKASLAAEAARRGTNGNGPPNGRTP